jgi:hypothetical protein
VVRWLRRVIQGDLDGLHARRNGLESVRLDGVVIGDVAERACHRAATERGESRAIPVCDDIVVEGTNSVRRAMEVGLSPVADPAQEAIAVDQEPIAIDAKHGRGTRTKLGL